MNRAKVAPMVRCLNAGFRAVRETNPKPLDTRHEMIRNAALFAAAEQNYLGMDGLLGYAVKGLGFVAFSAYAKAKKESAVPVTAARNSIGLLGIAGLEHNDEQNIQYEDGIISSRLGLALLKPEFMEFHGGERPYVDFTDYYKWKIDRLSVNDGGCPAQGAALEAVYTSYVDTVFARQLSRESVATSSQ